MMVAIFWVVGRMSHKGGRKEASSPGDPDPFDKAAPKPEVSPLWDKIVFPIIVSGVGGAMTAIILYLIGMKK